MKARPSRRGPAAHGTPAPAAPAAPAAPYGGGLRQESQRWRRLRGLVAVAAGLSTGKQAPAEAQASEDPEDPEAAVCHTVCSSVGLSNWSAYEAPDSTAGPSSAGEGQHARSACHRLPASAWLRLLVAVIAWGRGPICAAIEIVWPKWCRDPDSSVRMLIAWASAAEFVYQACKHSHRLRHPTVEQGIEMTELDGQPAKFVATKLILGETMKAAHGLRLLLGLKPGEEGVGNMLDVMEAEINGPHGDVDDQQNFWYIRYGEGKEEHIPAAVKRSIAAGKYHGGVIFPGDYDRGHGGRTLSDWMRQPEVVVAKLTEAEFVALRFYTSSSFGKINGPLREGVNRHPWAFTVLCLAEAVKKMRAVKVQDGPSFMKKTALWRGMKNMSLDVEAFKAQGGTELALMSTTTDPAVAMNYARSEMPLVFKYNVDGLKLGVCIHFCSLYPKEEEYLYPPLTFLKYQTDYKDGGVHIVEMEPIMA